MGANGEALFCGLRVQGKPPRPEISLIAKPIVVGSTPTIPEVHFGHFLSLCDGTGMLQHAIHSVADRAHGYCVDDNARALLFANALFSSGEARLPEPVTGRFAAFIQHAWNRTRAGSEIS